jgi:arsenate reductase
MYGIVNCDRVRSARAWLEHHVDYRFHDFRRDGLTLELLEAWCGQVAWATLLNRQGTTWRKLDPESAAGAQDHAGALALMLSHPTLIRRPVLQHGATLTIGFDTERYSRLFTA